MKAARWHQYGGPESMVYEEIAAPVPASGEVLVDTHAIGVNFTDILASEGRSQLSRVLPLVPGVEAAGIVRAVGSAVTRIKVGQRVLGCKAQGTYAEQVLFSEDEVSHIPEQMDMCTAATFYVGAMTAHYGICDRAKLGAGETLLVLGAGGGTGLAAVEIGKAVGARVVAAASSEDKLRVAVQRGADATYVYPLGPLDQNAQKKLTADLFALSPHKRNDELNLGKISSVHEASGYDVIFDGIGGTYAEPALRALAYQGRYLAVGFASGMPKVTLGPVLFKDASILGIQPADDRVRVPGRSPARMKQLFAWYLEGRLVPQVSATFPLARAGEALRLLASRNLNGRIALVTELGEKTRG
jgi:NADPH:quinone reductase